MKPTTTAAILAAALLGPFGSTSFSQTPEPAAPVAPAPMVLPAENVELTDAQGRTITATVLRKDANGITIQTADGAQYFVPWAKLSAETVTKITGKPAAAVIPPAAPAPPTKAELQAMMKWASEFRTKVHKLPAKDLLDMYHNKDADMMRFLEIVDAKYDSKMRYWRSKDPARAQRMSSAVTFMPLLKVSDEDETVSLRPDFEKVGVVAHQQSGDTCVVHAAYHMYQYECRKAGLPVPSFDTVFKRTDYQYMLVFPLQAGGKNWSSKTSPCWVWLLSNTRSSNTNSDRGVLA